MKIKSKVKDYYDHVAYLYGGGDPKISYNRSRIRDMEITKDSWGRQFENDGPFSIKHKENVVFLPNERTIVENGIRVTYEFSVLIAAGRQFLLYRERSRENKHAINGTEYAPNKHELSNFKILTEKANFALFDIIYHSTLVGVRTPPTYEESDNLIKLSQQIGHPAFVITSWDRYTDDMKISRKCPNLGEMGMASIFSPEQMYQMMEYFVGNRINSSPDMMPTPNPGQTNREKIESHGFDFKTSFRGK